MTTWAEVHVGDTVRGADQRLWVVVGRERATDWVNVRSGQPWSDATFTMQCGERRVTVARNLADPVDLTSFAPDREDVARAFGVLADAGLEPKVIEEKMTEDPFDSPAAKEYPRIENGRYVLPDPETGAEKRFTRASTFAKTIADEYMLTQWKLRQVAKGMAIRPDLVALAASADPEDDRTDLQTAANSALDAAEAAAGANLGTSLHTFTRRMDAGEPVAGLRPPPPLDRDLAAYATAMKQHGLSKVESERVVLCPDIGIAGRFDAIVSQPPGVAMADPLSIFDLKTGQKLDYSWLEILIQLAIYVHARFMWDQARQCWVPMPAVDQTRALVLHLPAGGAAADPPVAPELYALDIAWGWQQVLLSTHVRAARRDAKKHVVMVKPSDPKALALFQVQRADSREALAKLWDRFAPAGLWTDDVAAAGMARLSELEGVSK